MRRPNHRLLPRLDVLGERALPSATVEAVGGVVTIRGDQRANEIVITDTGAAAAGNVSVVADNKTYTFDTAITEVRVAGGGGGDAVTYNLTGDLTGQRVVTADLGNGNDEFNAVLTGNLLAGADLNLEARGQNGQDALDLEADGDVAAGAALAVVLDGGNGKDGLTVDYAGLIQGEVTLEARGGNGKDTLTGTVAADAGSAGTVVAQWLGGNGVDTVDLTVTGAEGLSSLDASVDGGRGKDRVAASDNVDVLDE